MKDLLSIIFVKLSKIVTLLTIFSKGLLCLYIDSNILYSLFNGVKQHDCWTKAGKNILFSTGCLLTILSNSDIYFKE